MATRPGGSSGHDRIRRELRQALRNGPFAAALHLAIEARGLTLDEVQLWLAERGARVSAPMLSYWRRGRSRPERAASLQAVRLLEELLDVPADSLISLLGPRRPRGRWIGHAPGSVDLDGLFPGAEPLSFMSDGAVPFGTGALRRVGVHVTVSAGADQLVTSIHTRELLRAEVDRASRYLVLYVADERPDNPPVLTGVRYCRVGRTKVDRTTGLTCVELILDRVLHVGEPALLEYEWRFTPGLRMTDYAHGFAQPTREYVLQARFHQDAVPMRCVRYERRALDAEDTDHQELWIGASNTALVAESDVTTGLVGMRWEWPDGQGV